MNPETNKEENFIQAGRSLYVHTLSRISKGAVAKEGYVFLVLRIKKYVNDKRGSWTATQQVPLEMTEDQIQTLADVMFQKANARYKII